MTLFFFLLFLYHQNSQKRCFGSFKTHHGLYQETLTLTMMSLMAQSEERHYWVGSPNQRPSVLSLHQEFVQLKLPGVVYYPQFYCIIQVVIKYGNITLLAQDTKFIFSVVTTSLDSKGAKTSLWRASRGPIKSHSISSLLHSLYHCHCQWYHNWGM